MLAPCGPPGRTGRLWYSWRREMERTELHGQVSYKMDVLGKPLLHELIHFRALVSPPLTTITSTALRKLELWTRIRQYTMRIVTPGLPWRPIGPQFARGASWTWRRGNQSAEAKAKKKEKNDAKRAAKGHYELQQQQQQQEDGDSEPRAKRPKLHTTHASSTKVLRVCSRISSYEHKRSHVCYGESQVGTHHLMQYTLACTSVFM
jgi:hypothetical protein